MFKQSKISILRDSINKVTQILTKKDIRVTQYGTSAFVERDAAGIPVSVNLPYVPDSASDELLAAMQGFVDHEVAHVLHSDAKAARSAKMKGEKIEKLYGFFNDAHAESAMRKTFKGSARNLAELASYYTDRRLKQRWEELTESGASENEKLGSMMGAVTRAWAGDVFYEDFMRDKWDDMAGVLDKIPQSFIDKVSKVKSSDDALNLTTEFLKYIETQDEPEQDDDSSDDSSSSIKTSMKGQKGKGKSKPEKSEQDEDEDENDDSDDNEEAPESDSNDDSDDSDSDGDDEDENDSEGDSGDDENENDGEDDEDSGDDDDSEEESDSESGGGNVGGSPSFDDGLEDAAKNDLINELNRDIERDLKDVPDQYIPLTTDFDAVIPSPTIEEIIKSGKAYKYNAKSNPEEVATTVLASLHDKMLENVGASAKQLEKAFVAQNRTFYEPGKRSGRLNPSSLFKLQTGDDRVFRKKVDVRAKNTAVSLVMDQSGSMSGEKIQAAAIACYALADLLERIKVPYEIVGFTTGDYPGSFRAKRRSISDDMHKRLRRGPSRDDVIRLYSYKDWGERLEYEQKSRMAAAYDNLVHMWSNIDGESIMMAAERLSQQKAERHCMIVMSDGQPAGGGQYNHLHTHLKKTVKKIESAGIEVVGLGICDGSVKNYYTNHIVFHKPSELAERVMGQLTQMLMGSVK